MFRHLKLEQATKELSQARDIRSSLQDEIDTLKQQLLESASEWEQAAAMKGYVRRQCDSLQARGAALRQELEQRRNVAASHGKQLSELQADSRQMLSDRCALVERQRHLENAHAALQLARDTVGESNTEVPCPLGHQPMPPPGSPPTLLPDTARGKPSTCPFAKLAAEAGELEEHAQHALQLHLAQQFNAEVRIYIERDSIKKEFERSVKTLAKAQLEYANLRQRHTQVADALRALKHKVEELQNKKRRCREQLEVAATAKERLEEEHARLFSDLDSQRQGLHELKFETLRDVDETMGRMSRTNQAKLRLAAEHCCEQQELALSAASSRLSHVSPDLTPKPSSAPARLLGAASPQAKMAFQKTCVAAPRIPHPLTSPRRDFRGAAHSILGGRAD